MNGDINKEARIWGMWCHLSSIAVWIPILIIGSLGIPIPFANILAPLIIWQTKKNTHPFIDAQGKESLNFQISMLIYSIIGTIIGLFLGFLTCGIAISANQAGIDAILVTLLITVAVIIILLLIFQLFVVLFASFKAYKGNSYFYPFTIRFLR